MKRRYKSDISQEQFEKAVSHSYPMTFEKDGIGGSFADAFNAGYEGRKGGIYRYTYSNSAGNIFYQAGKERKRLDTKIMKNKNTKNELYPQFRELVLKLQLLKKEHGDDYIEKCKKEIEIVGKAVKSNGLIELCENQHFAKQLLMVNDVPEKYWK
jgi:hypothetical protein